MHVADARAALATVLILRELGLAVDLAADPETALHWAARARYEVLLVVGGHASTGLLLRMRAAAPGARVLLLYDDARLPGGPVPPGVEVLWPPVEVNALMRSLWPQE